MMIWPPLMLSSPVRKVSFNAAIPIPTWKDQRKHSSCVIYKGMQFTYCLTILNITHFVAKTSKLLGFILTPEIIFSHVKWA